MKARTPTPYTLYAAALGATAGELWKLKLPTLRWGFDLSRSIPGLGWMWEGADGEVLFPWFGWLATVARNLAHNRRRDDALRRRRESAAPRGNVVASTEDVVAREQLRQQVALT